MTELRACVKYTKARRAFLAKFLNGVYHTVDDELYNAIDLLYEMRGYITNTKVRMMLDVVPKLRASNNIDKMSAIVVTLHNYIDGILVANRNEIVPDIVGLSEHFKTDVILPGQVIS